MSDTTEPEAASQVTFSAAWRDTPPPSEAVWSRIATEVGLGMGGPTASRAVS